MHYRNGWPVQLGDIVVGTCLDHQKHFLYGRVAGMSTDDLSGEGRLTIQYLRGNGQGGTELATTYGDPQDFQRIDTLFPEENAVYRDGHTPVKVGDFVRGFLPTPVTADKEVYGHVVMVRRTPARTLLQILVQRVRPYKVAAIKTGAGWISCSPYSQVQIEGEIETGYADQFEPVPLRACPVPDETP